MTRRDEASLRQVLAASPQHSTWLAANAGSGKTKVLTDRVARLLLAGTEPQRVLCLTYTKAAAAEMQNRLLKRLGAWSMLDDTSLRAELRALGEETQVDAEGLAKARRLFAQAIEAPGGLKIQTIHAFCAALLRRFPLEAGVAHGFSELDERSATRMREEILEDIAAGPARTVLDDLLRQVGGESLPRLIEEISRNRAAFAPVSEAELRRLLDLPQGFTAQDLPSTVFLPETPRLIAAVLEGLSDGTKTSSDLAQALNALDLRNPGLADLRLLEERFLHKGKAERLASLKKPGSILTKGATKALGEELCAEFMALAERVCRAKEMEFSLQSLRRTLALHRFAQELLPRLEARKARGGWLDFEDLIERAGALLSDPGVAQWVLFRLDGGIDHILVDEAQDTSPGQWRVIERLADEFTAGDGARPDRRTIFVVGDRKQSIYSFQGADLGHFKAVESRFSGRFAAIDRPLQNAALLHSFRSSAAILRLVDLVFQGPPAEGLGGAPEHLAFHDTLPGRVDLWPAVGKTEAPEPENWQDPVDLPGEESAHVLLARAIASEIRAMIDTGVHIPLREGSRAVHEGDFLILLQKRSPLFYEIIRACKAERLEVAGADRMRLGAELAVKDILAVLAFLATPEDDLSLASALRSPLFGWSEAELYRLAQPREGYLWQALRAEETPARDILHDLLDHAEFLRPYELIERILTRHDGRRRLVARLGAEALEGIDEVVSQALTYEQSEVPSLTGFLVWLEAEKIDIKRQGDSAGRALRVMTVHGSKGLEAPIVILPDTAKPQAPRGGDILLAEEDRPFWGGGGETLPPALAQSRADLAENARKERLRLLYVALTRAEKWLIVATTQADASDAESWYGLVAQGLERAGTETVEAQSAAARRLGTLRRFAHGRWPEPGRPAPPAAPPEVALPAWALARLPAPVKAAQALSASDLGGAKALPGEVDALTSADALRRGRQLHLLLEHLPQWPEARWAELAYPLLAGAEDGADLAETETVLASARRVLAAVAAAGYLGADTLTEVTISAPIPELGGQVLHGVIDLLQIGATRLRLLDYKSNSLVPASAEEVPQGLLRQMAAYRSALRQIYPGRAVETALLWTATGTLMALPDKLLDAALRAPTAS